MSAPLAVTVTQAAALKTVVGDDPQVRGATVGMPGAPGSPGLTGDAGAPGEPGAAGPPGPAGGSPFEHSQDVPAASWTVTHNLGRRPAGVTVYDVLDDEVETGVRIIDVNTIEITMVAPAAGRVVVT